jgi:hypothetical protein
VLQVRVLDIFRDFQGFRVRSICVRFAFDLDPGERSICVRFGFRFCAWFRHFCTFRGTAAFDLRSIRGVRLAFDLRSICVRLAFEGATWVLHRFCV